MKVRNEMRTATAQTELITYHTAEVKETMSVREGKYGDSNKTENKRKEKKVMMKTIGERKGERENKNQIENENGRRAERTRHIGMKNIETTREEERAREKDYKMSNDGSEY